MIGDRAAAGDVLRAQARGETYDQLLKRLADDTVLDQKAGAGRRQGLDLTGFQADRDNRRVQRDSPELLGHQAR